MTEILVIGWDGASHDHVQEIELDYFDSMDNSGKLLPEKIYQGMAIDSGYAWSSICTGLEIEEHGIMSLNNMTRSKEFLSLSKKIARLIPSNRLRTYFFYGANKAFNLEGRTPRSTDIPYKRLWDYWGGKTLTIGVPMTYPAWKHNGIMISGIPGPVDGDQPSAHPKSYERYRKKFDAYYYLEKKSPLQSCEQPNRQDYIDAVYESNQEAVKVTRELANEEDFSLIFAVFPLIDDLLHAFDPEQEQDKIEKAYQWMDEKTEELVEEIDPENVLILSDHGMMPSDKSLQLSLPGGMKMDHDSMNGIWASNLDLDLEVQTDLVPRLLEEFGYESEKTSLEMELGTSEEDEEKIKKHLEKMGYLER